jgi:sialidase-1
MQSSKLDFRPFLVLLALHISTLLFTQTPVFQSGEAGYACFRIPAIVCAPNGELLAFCEARKDNCQDHGDVRIVMKRSQDQGRTWSEPTVVVENGNAQAGNPAPVFDAMDRRFPQGRLFLFCNTGTVSEQEVREGKAPREVWYKTSTDLGKTWSNPLNITVQVSKPLQLSSNPKYKFAEDWRSYANTPGHALQIQHGKKRGRIFVPANHSAGPPQARFKDYRAHAFYSDDHGKSWKISPNVEYPGSNESTAAELLNDGVLMNIRDQSGESKLRLLAYSKNAGKKWDAVYLEKQLPDPVCEGSMINFQDKNGKNWLLFSNLEHQSKRQNLVLKASDDDGKTWSLVQVICEGSSAYSDLVIQKDGQIGVLYERDNYSQIVYQILSFSP